MHNTSTDRIPISISLCDGIRDRHPGYVETDWAGFRELLYEHAFELETLEDKHRVYALTPGLLAGRRSIDSVVSADIVAFDSDRPHVPIAFFVEEAQALGEAMFVHTTVKHRDEAPRFHIFQPLSRRLKSNGEYRALWRARHAAFLRSFEARGGSAEDMLDRAPRNASSLFFFPSFIEKPVRWEHVIGTPVDVDKYLAELAPPPPREPPKIAARATPGGLVHLSLHHSTLVTPQVIADYHAAGEGNYHREFFRALCRIAARAKHHRFPLDLALLAQIAAEIDLDSPGGPYYSMKIHEDEAANALRWVAP